jgi:uncharacterized damage-inducible protein DinB
VIESFRRLYLYDAWANHRAMEAVVATPGLGERSRDVAAHVIAAQRVWLARLRGQDSAGFEVWPASDAHALTRGASEMAAGYADLLARLSESDLDVGLTYRNQAGREFLMTPRDILNHVLLHSASHRGEVLAAVGDAGGDAPDTDHIAWLRAGEPSA